MYIIIRNTTLLIIFIFAFINIISCDNKVYNTRINTSDSSASVYDLQFNHDGELLLSGDFKGFYDLNPFPEQNTFTSSTTFSPFLTIFNPDLTFKISIIWEGEGGASFENIAFDSDGNIIIVGVFSGHFRIKVQGVDTDISCNEMGDCFLIKMQPDGEIVWFNSWGSTMADKVNGLTVDLNDNIYVCGSVGPYSDIDPSSTSLIRKDAGSFISKFDTEGNFIWAKGWDSGIYDITIDDSDIIYITGIFYFDSIINAYDGDSHIAIYSAYLTSLDDDGNILWSNTWGFGDDHELDVTEGDGCVATCLDISGDSIYVGGQVEGNVDFNPSDNEIFDIPQWDTHLFIVCYSKSGEYQWYRTWGDDSGNMADLTINDGVITVCGEVRGYVDFDPGENETIFECETGPSPQYFDAFIAQYNLDGSFIWADVWGEPGPDLAKALATDGNSIFVAGNIGDEIYVKQYDFAGNEIK